MKMSAAFFRSEFVRLLEASRKACLTASRSCCRAVRWTASVCLRLIRSLRPLGIAIAILVAVILWEAFATRSLVQVDPFTVPKEFEERGFTSETIVNRAADQIANIEQAARAAKFASRIELTPAFPDIEVDVSATRLPVWAAVRFAQSLLDIEPLHISGEVTSVSNSGQQHLSITMRATRKKERRRVQFDVMPAEAETAIAAIAQQMLRLVDLSCWAYTRLPFKRT